MLINFSIPFYLIKNYNLFFMRIINIFSQVNNYQMLNLSGLIPIAPDNKRIYENNKSISNNINYIKAMY